MDNHLTPNKIQKMLFFAQEDKSFSARKRLPLTDEGTKCLDIQDNLLNKSSMHFESSSGILDLERVEGFGESGVGISSLSKSTTFNPGEMTGRSTGTDDIKSETVNKESTKAGDMFEEYGRHSFALENLTSNLEKQTMEVHDIMRHSIATNYSFNSKRDLTADEASFVVRQAPLPVQQSSHVNITTDNTLDNNTNMSMGSYFKNRCPEFTNILAKTDSPSRSMRPSINEGRWYNNGVGIVSRVNSISSPSWSPRPAVPYQPTSSSLSMSVPIESSEINANSLYKMDQSLDCIPVRQSKNTENSKASIKQSTFNINHSNLPYSYAVPEISVSSGKTEVIPKITKLESYKNELNEVQEDKRKMDQKLLQKMFIQSLSTEQFLKKAHLSPFQIPTEESGASFDNENTENSLSISKIADYLGKQSNVSVSGMLQLNNQRKQINKKQPLAELHMNVQNNKKIKEEILVTKLKDAKKMETASSASTMDTVISLEKMNINKKLEKTEIPEVVVTRHSMYKNDSHDIDNKSRTIRSKSPSSKSQSTLSTVQENFMSFKSSNSPLHNTKGEANLTHIPSPNVEYKELDKSVDWQEILQHKHFKKECLAKVQWAEIHSSTINGFVGTNNAATITITTLTDSWLTAKIKFDNLPNGGQDLTIELPRQPVLLCPGKTEQFSLHIMSNVEINTTLPFSVYIKDASIDGEIEQIGELQVNFKMPAIQMLSCDGINKLVFPPLHENTSLTRYFVILSDCPVDLQLDLSIVEGGSMFTIKSVQEISKNEVSKALTERHGSGDEQARIGKSKGNNKQLCRLSSGNAIRVSILFKAPKLTKSDPKEKSVTCNGSVKVCLFGIEAVLKTMDLVGVIASANLEVEIPMQKLQMNANERKSLILRNTGSIAGIWSIKIQDKMSNDPNVPFQISSHRVEIHPGGEKQLNLLYTGAQDVICEAILVLEDANTGNKKIIDICGGTDRPTVFPIKTNYTTMSWVRAGRKELSLRNSTNKKIQIRCQIVGEGFSIDLSRVESRGIYSLSFGPNDCRQLPIVFAPMSPAPHAAALHLVYDKSNEFSRKVKLFGCASDGSVRWNGLVTHGDTALLRATAREPVNLTLYNKYNVPAFVSARVHFNLQYRCCVNNSQLEGARHVVGARGRHAVVLRPQWARLERRAREVNAAALAAVSVLTGPEITRRRILRIIKNKTTGELDTSLLPDHLKVLTHQFEGQDIVPDESLKDFEETTTSLNELIESLQELNAHIALPQDFADENTIIITDETVLEHHTLCD